MLIENSQNSELKSAQKAHSPSTGYSENTSGLYKVWQAEQSIWTFGIEVLKDFIHEDAIISGPSPADRKTGREILSLKRFPRPFDTIKLLNRKYYKDDSTIIIDYLALAKHPRFRQPHLALCQTLWKRSNQSLGKWKIIGHTHRVISQRDFRDICPEALNS